MLSKGAFFPAVPISCFQHKSIYRARKSQALAALLLRSLRPCPRRCRAPCRSSEAQRAAGTRGSPGAWGAAAPRRVPPVCGVVAGTGWGRAASPLPLRAPHPAFLSLSAFWSSIRYRTLLTSVRWEPVGTATAQFVLAPRVSLLAPGQVGNIFFSLNKGVKFILFLFPAEVLSVMSLMRYGLCCPWLCRAWSRDVGWVKAHEIWCGDSSVTDLRRRAAPPDVVLSDLPKPRPSAFVIAISLLIYSLSLVGWRRGADF